MAKTQNAKPMKKKPAVAGKTPSKADKMPGYMKKAQAAAGKGKGGSGC